MRMHLILYHSTKELEFWGISRKYLKFQEGMLPLEDIIGHPVQQPPGITGKDDGPQFDPSDDYYRNKYEKPGRPGN